MKNMDDFTHFNTQGREKMVDVVESKAPSLDMWMKEAKKSKDASKIGMFLFHNGVVRESAREMVRLERKNIGPVIALELSYDKEKVEEAVNHTLRKKGIYYVRVWINEGTLNVGDDMMLVLIGGDIRPRVVEALQSLVEIIKTECVTEKELF